MVLFGVKWQRTPEGPNFAPKIKRSHKVSLFLSFFLFFASTSFIFHMNKVAMIVVVHSCQITFLGDTIRKLFFITLNNLNIEGKSFEELYNTILLISEKLFHCK